MRRAAPARRAPGGRPRRGWGRKGGETHFGYEANGVDQGSGLVRKVTLTAANVNDTVPADELLSGDEAAVYADKAYAKARRALLPLGVKDRAPPEQAPHRFPTGPATPSSPARAPSPAQGEATGVRYRASRRTPSAALHGPTTCGGRPSCSQAPLPSAGASPPPRPPSPAGPLRGRRRDGLSSPAPACPNCAFGVRSACLTRRSPKGRGDRRDGRGRSRPSPQPSPAKGEGAGGLGWSPARG